MPEEQTCCVFNNTCDRTSKESVFIDFNIDKERGEMLDDK
jgi:hypothetical protein